MDMLVLHNYVSWQSYNCCSLWQPGITTDEIDKAVHQMIIENGAYPSPLGYCGFPKSVCTSVNECICHGIPDSRPLEVTFFDVTNFCIIFSLFTLYKAFLFFYHRMVI
jgi:Xaa-Pro aminopeptidase